MLDPKLLRSGLEETARQLLRRGVTLDTQKITALDNQRKTLQVLTQTLQSETRDLLPSGRVSWMAY